MKAIIVDLDGTLCDMDHRRHFLVDKNWNDFFDHLDQDTLNDTVYNVVMLLKKQQSCRIILMTGRPNAYREKTIAWLQKYGVEFDMLLMRQDKDYRPDYIVKMELYEKYVKPIFCVTIVFDDRNSVVKAWRQAGLQCWQVNDE